MSQAGALRFTGGGGGGTILTLTGNSGGPVGPDGFGDINVIGDGTTITVAGNPGTSTLTISVLGSVAIQFTADDANVATPIGGNLNIFGGPNINTAAPGSADTIQVNLNNSILLPATVDQNTGTIALGTDLFNDRFLHNYGPNDAASDNTFIGHQSGNYTLSGENNTGIGGSTLGQLSTGEFNTAVGLESLNLLTSGSNNTAVGAGSLSGIDAGSDNIAIGSNSGSGFQTGNESNNITIGNDGLNSESDVIRIGNTQTEAYMAGVYQKTPGVNFEAGFVGSDGKLGTLTLNNGQLIIGSTGSSPVIANITSVDNTITITNGAGSIDLSTTGGVLFTVTTNNAVPTALITHAVVNNTAVTINATVVAAKSDFSAALFGSVVIGARRSGGGAILVDIPTINFGDDSAAAPILTADVSGNNVRLLVTGVIAETWNWKATAIIITQT